MTIQNLNRQIRALPYADMMQIATEISNELTKERIRDPSPTRIAEILCALAAKDAKLSEATKQEERLLQGIFSRKRSINVSRQHSGWSLICTTLPGSTVLGTELRPMFPLMMDQILTMHVLGK